MAIAAVTVIWVSPATLHFLSLCVLKLRPSLYLVPSLIYRRQLRVCLCDLLVLKTAKFTEYYSIRLLTI